jgi:Mg2+ and Co2+ transporter CorA
MDDDELRLRLDHIDQGFEAIAELVQPLRQLVPPMTAEPSLDRDDEGLAESVARSQRVANEFALGDSSGIDVGGSLFTVMLEYQKLMNKEHREELAAIERERERLCQIKLALERYNQFADGGLKDDVDSLSEMGEMESLRLQMAMDRMSKMMSTLSNLLKKISDTASTITANIK